MKNDVAKSILMQMPGMATNIVAGGLQHRARQAQMNAAREQQESQFQREMQRLRDQAAHRERIENQDAAWNEWQRNLARPGMEIEARNAPDIAEAKRRIAMADAESRGLDVTLKRDTLPFNVEAARINAESGQDALNRGRDLHPLNKQGLQLRNRSMQQEMRMREADYASKVQAASRFSAGIPEDQKVSLETLHKPESQARLAKMVMSAPISDPAIRKELLSESILASTLANRKQVVREVFSEMEKLVQEGGLKVFIPGTSSNVKFNAAKAKMETLARGVLKTEPNGQEVQQRLAEWASPGFWEMAVNPERLNVQRQEALNFMDLHEGKSLPYLHGAGYLRSAESIPEIPFGQDYEAISMGMIPPEGGW